MALFVYQQPLLVCQIIDKTKTKSCKSQDTTTNFHLKKAKEEARRGKGAQWAIIDNFEQKEHGTISVSAGYTI